MTPRALRVWTWLLASLCALGSSARAAAASHDARLIEGAAERSGRFFLTGDEGAVYEVGHGATVTLSPGSRFSFHESLKLKLHEPTAPSTVTEVVQLEAGHAEVTTQSEGAPAVMVRTTRKVNGVTKPGGRSVSIVRPDAVTVAALVGEMFVGVGSQWRPLPEGQARTRTPSDPMATPRSLLEAPLVEVASPLLLLQDGEATAPAVTTWNAVPGAAEYSVVAKLGDTVVEQTRVTTPRYETRTLKPGALAITVTPVDEYGLAGHASRPVEVRAVGLRKPEGSRVTDDGAVVLGRGDRIALTGADGLEIAYNSARYFMQAPPEVGLARNEPTVVRLRRPGTSEEASFRLMPLGLRATVRLTPKTAQWPRDRVRVTIELHDAFGRGVPRDARFESRVTINLQPVELEWQRSGTTLSAVVPRASGDGPWIVRAEVRNTDGESIGRNFLEIAHAAKSQPDRRAHSGHR